nr:MAG TPA: hypothetical protein [Bacteriophage sp.]
MYCRGLRILTKDLGLLLVLLYTQPQYGSFCELGLSRLTN